MRKIFQKNVLSPEKKQINENNYLRPKTAFKNRELPIKLINRKALRTKPGITKTTNSLTKTKITFNSHYNNYNSKDDDLFFSGDENTTKSNQKHLPLLSQTEPNIFNKRAQSANIKFKIKLENINSMFKNEPKLYFSTQKK